MVEKLQKTHNLYFSSTVSPSIMAVQALTFGLEKKRFFLKPIRSQNNYRLLFFPPLFFLANTMFFNKLPFVKILEVGQYFGFWNPNNVKTSQP